jgi:hypothetical protein
MEIKDPDISHERVKELLDYDPETGVFTRRLRRPGWPPGAVAGSEVDGYWLLCLDRKYVWAHRVAWFYVHGSWPTQLIDHKNQNKLDNRIDNLREATISQNRQNMTKYKSNTSGHKGVHWQKAARKWHAQISVDKKKHHLGLFDKLEDAAAAYANAAARLHSFNPDAATAGAKEY